MIVGLYTGRVMLQALGVDNYGINNVVGGLSGVHTRLHAAECGPFLQSPQTDAVFSQKISPRCHAAMRHSVRSIIHIATGPVSLYGKRSDAFYYKHTPLRSMDSPVLLHLRSEQE